MYPFRFMRTWSEVVERKGWLHLVNWLSFMSSRRARQKDGRRLALIMRRAMAQLSIAFGSKKRGGRPRSDGVGSC